MTFSKPSGVQRPAVLARVDASPDRYSSADVILAAARTFVTVVETGSMSAAARLMGLSPARISKAIAELERQLGHNLLQRSTRRQQMSEAGKSFYSFALAALDKYEDLKEQLAVLQQTKRDSIYLLIEANTLAYWLPQRLNRFRARHPAIELDVHGSIVTPARLADTAYDLIIGSDILATSEGRAVKIATRDIGIYRSPCREADANILYLTSDLGMSHLAAFRDVAHMRLEDVSSLEVARGLAEAGMGYCLLYADMAAAAISEGRLEAVPNLRSSSVSVYAWAAILPMRDQISALVEAIQDPPTG